MQTPGGTAANDVALYDNANGWVQLPNLSTQAGSVDRNRFFGIVIYIPGRGIGHPLSVTRINYAYEHDDWGQP